MSTFLLSFKEVDSKSYIYPLFSRSEPLLFLSFKGACKTGLLFFFPRSKIHVQTLAPPFLSPQGGFSLSFFFYRKSQYFFPLIKTVQASIHFKAALTPSWVSPLSFAIRKKSSMDLSFPPQCSTSQRPNSLSPFIKFGPPFPPPPLPFFSFR